MQALTPDSILKRLAREGRLTAALALPLAAGQISQMLMPLADTLMVGRLGVLPLAAAFGSKSGVGFMGLSASAAELSASFCNATLREGGHLALHCRTGYGSESPDESRLCRGLVTFRPSFTGCLAQGGDSY